MLIAGGSAAALLAFAGSACSGLKPEGIEALSHTLVYLGTAIFLTGLATAVTYLAQYFSPSAYPGMKRPVIVASGLHAPWCWLPMVWCLLHIYRPEKC
ncbi:hypothetical protein D3C78_1753950 [compost metagenome]